MIDRAFFQAKPSIYFRDFFISMVIFLGALAWGLKADWPLVAIPCVVAAAFVARLGIFAHELSHRPSDRSMKLFYWVWQLTAGALVQMPSARFVEPHKAHHTTGIFRTKDDPQYLLVRSDGKLAVFVLVLLPFLTPLYTFFQILIASIGGLRLEEAMDAFTRRKFNFSISTPLPPARKSEVTWLARYYLVLYALFAFLLPQALPFYYAVLVGGWLVVVLRIPLEHELERYAETSESRDQMLDSFTVETPLAVIVQPLGFRYHTAHHMYPGVPYHNLPALHEHLKATVPQYRNSILPYWTAIRRARPAAGPQNPARDTI